MIIIKTAEEIKTLREGGRRLATILNKVKDMVAPGVSTKDLDLYAERLVREGGDKPAFLNYKPDGAPTPFPASLCVSINDEVVHGIPKKNKVLKEGDIVSLDLGLNHVGMFTDMAITVPVGKVSKKLEKLLFVAQEALRRGIQSAQPGFKVGDIGSAVESYVRPHKFGIVEVLAGHGVGRAIHEDPYIPNFGRAGTGEELRPGMVIAIEPMLNLGTKNVVLERDGYTFRTADGRPSAHFEHTILITDKGSEILTSAL